jgi:hypothetical protein
VQHYFNFQGSAAFAVLSFLGLGLASLVAAIACVVLCLMRRWQTTTLRVLQGAAGIWALYFVVLLAFSFTSREQSLAVNQEKYFCEVDCHLAYSVLDVTRVSTLGDAASNSAARGAYYVVTVQTRFDENTISAHRPKDAPLQPNPRLVSVIDADGRKYEESPAGVKALESIEGPRVPLARQLRPGESYVTKLVFDLPADVRNPRLKIVEADWVTHLLIGHENSFFHKQTLFSLGS